ncbi:hypothetical protein BLNAU_10210 [Blattamonas nauphoetae]|uniref:Protein kinase domain-containing protein n=1 Tax=Blattamonas nauphoetae TaxID=2049346 RepID=A0ABQ9XTT4_9EUKA|nr:hypothetical protein BLNAU_10210 [Blattamonas nauphoetae]
MVRFEPPKKGPDLFFSPFPRFMAAPLLILSIFVALSSSSRPVVPFKPRSLDEKLTRSFNSNENRNRLPNRIVLDRDSYIGKELPVVGQTLDISGTSTLILHSNQIRPEQNVDLGHTKLSHPPKLSPIFVLSNSTMSLSTLSISAVHPNAIICSLSSSVQFVSNCRITSNGQQCPFVVVDGQTTESTSITMLNVSHQIPNTFSLLPLISSQMGLNNLQRHLHSSSPLTIVGIGLSMSHTILPRSTGPLFDFGAPSQVVKQLNHDLTVTLSTSTFENMTTHSQPPRREHHPRLAQTVVGSTLSSSSGNIWSAVSLEMNTGGSFSAINSSFSHIHPSLLLSPPPTSTPNQDTNPYYFPEYDQPHCERSMFILARCLFRCMAYDQPILIVEVAGAPEIGIRECLFIECRLHQSSPEACESMISFVFPQNDGMLHFENVLFLEIDTQHVPCLLIQGMQHLSFYYVFFLHVHSQESSVCVFNSNEDCSLCEICFTRCYVQETQWILILQDSRIHNCHGIAFRGNFWDNELSVIDCAFYNPDQSLGTTDRWDQSYHLQQVYESIRLQHISSYTDQDGQLVITLELSDMPQNPSSLMLVAWGTQNEEQTALLLLDGMSGLYIRAVSMPEVVVEHDSPVILVSQQTVYVMSSGIKVGKDGIWLFTVSFMSEYFMGSAVNFTAESGGEHFTQEFRFECTDMFDLEVPVNKSCGGPFSPGSFITLSMQSDDLCVDWFVLECDSVVVPVNHQLTEFADSAVLNEDGTVSVFVRGVNLTNHEIVVELNSSIHSESVLFNEETGKFVFNTTQNGYTPGLDIGAEYSITSFTVDGYSLVPSAQLVFTVPLPLPVEVQVDSSAGVVGRKFTVSFYSTDLAGMEVMIEVSRDQSLHQEVLAFNSEGRCDLVVDDLADHSFFTFEADYSLSVVACPLNLAVLLVPDSFSIPANPQKTIAIESHEYDEYGEYVLIILKESNIGSIPVNITFGNVNNLSDTYTCTVHFESWSNGYIFSYVYNQEGGVPDLKWGETYEIVQVSDGDGPIDDVLLSGVVEIMEEPARVTSVTVRCTSDKAFLTFHGIHFPPTFSFRFYIIIYIMSTTQSLQSNVNDAKFYFNVSSSNSTTAFSVVPAQEAFDLFGPIIPVAFDEGYDFETKGVYTSCRGVHIPHPTAVTSVSLVTTPSPTSFWLKVVGKNFEAGDRFRMSIVESVESNAVSVFEVIVEMSGSEDGQSAPFEVGRPSTLAFGKNYSVASLTLVSQEEFVVLTSETFTTPPKPPQMEILVDGKTGVDGDGCGGVSAPCQTLDKALSHVESTTIETVKVSVANKVTLSASHVLPADIVLVVDQNGETGSIWVPSDTSTAFPLLISSGGMLKLRNLVISIDSVSSDLCLLSSSDTTVELNSLRVTGPLLPTTSNSESVDEMGVCEWETGLVKVSGVSIVVIGKEESKSPFVMPTLDVGSSGGEQKRIGDAVKVRIVGEQLIPCAVSLELLDSSTTHNTTPASTTVLLSGAHVETCTDTLIVLNVSLDEISLDASNEWEGRLVFGSSLVTESFVVKRSVREVRSENAKKAMSWAIPVVVAVVALLIVIIVVIVIVWRRRQNKKEEGQEMADADQVEMDEKMEVIVADHQISTNPNNSMINSQPNEALTKEGNVSSDVLVDIVDEIEAVACGVGIEVVIVKKERTLYNRLHSEEKGGIVKRSVQGQIVRGLKMLSKKDRNTPIFLSLTSHNIVFDSIGRVCFKTSADIVQPTLTTLEPQIVPPPGVEFEDKATEERAHKKDEMSEAQRWLAPEVIEKKENIDATRAAVFSLGLLLWEVETGQVPYGEQDGVNACRQIVAGTLPPMDGIGLDSLKELIADCMALDPKKRPTLDEVESCLDSLPADADDSPPDASMRT